MLTPSVGKSRVIETLCSWAVNANCSHKALGRCLQPLQYAMFCCNTNFTLPFRKLHVMVLCMCSAWQGCKWGLLNIMGCSNENTSFWTVTYFKNNARQRLGWGSRPSILSPTWVFCLQLGEKLCGNRHMNSTSFSPSCSFNHSPTGWCNSYWQMLWILLKMLAIIICFGKNGWQTPRARWTMQVTFSCFITLYELCHYVQKMEN